MKSPKKASTTKTTKSSKTGTDKAKAKVTPKDSIPPKSKIIDDEDDDLDMDLEVDEFDAGFDDEDEFDDDEY